MSNTNKEKPALSACVGGRYRTLGIDRDDQGRIIHRRLGIRPDDIQWPDSLKEQTQRVPPTNEDVRPTDPNAVKNTIDKVMAVLENLRENGLVGKASPRGPDKGCG